IIFVGMTYMADALENLTRIGWVSALLLEMGQHPFVGVVAGLVMTSITQSSTAVTSMTVAMGISQAINLPGAIGIMQLSRPARQASVSQILINVVGVLLFLPFIGPYSNLIQITSHDLPRQIANAHSIFNVTVSALFFPFVKQVAQVSNWMIPSREKTGPARLTAYIDEMQFSVPAVALSEAARELVRLAEVTAEMVEKSCLALIEMKTELVERVLTLEEKFVDPVTKELNAFLNRLMGQELSTAQQKRCFQLKALLTDIERVGDMAEDIAQYAVERSTHQVPFTNPAIDELERLWRHAHTTYRLAIEAFQAGNKEQALQVCRLESQFDQMYWKTRQAHIERLEQGLCHPEADVIFTETLRTLERISDHADNLGVSVARS
ncbi:MAG: hypothetical protein MUE67_06585, partial [Anaerolineales bacterium]|nr:hypothetical protein [Anaerolineales bacterium]